MSNSRMTDFRKTKTVKETHATVNQTAADVQKMFQMLLGLAGRIYKLEQRFNSVWPIAKLADWRSLAIMKVLSGSLIPLGDSFATAVTAMAEHLQIEDFNVESQEDDLSKGLEVIEGIAAKGHYAIATVHVFKGDRELEDQHLVRIKIHLGSNELFPELDDVIIGMSVGESKRFKIELLGQTDSAVVTLLGLRQKVVPPAAPETTTPGG